MLKKPFFVYFITFVSLFFVGCIKYYHLSREEFPQGQTKNKYNSLRTESLRRIRIYDQFETKAIFDVLWFSDEVKVAYSDLLCNKQGKDDEYRSDLLEKLRNEGEHWEVFYVLADVREPLHALLSDKNPFWSLYLQIGENKISPISIKEIEFSPEISFLFGAFFSTLKSGYIVKFAVSEIGRKLSELKDGFKLFVSSPFRQSFTSWGEKQKKFSRKSRKGLKKSGTKIGEIDYEDFYWL